MMSNSRQAPVIDDQGALSFMESHPYWVLGEVRFPRRKVKGLGISRRHRRGGVFLMNFWNSFWDIIWFFLWGFEPVRWSV